jgi:hypothetical protein
MMLLFNIVFISTLYLSIHYLNCDIGGNIQGDYDGTIYTFISFHYAIKPEPKARKEQFQMCLLESRLKIPNYAANHSYSP